MSKIITIANPPPPIMQSFSRTLLTDYPSKKIDYETRKIERIQKLIERKIDERHSGKKKELTKLFTQWQIYYERAKIKEEDYETALKNAAKMPSIPITGGTCRFR